jgi:putative acetyltransferase
VNEVSDLTFRPEEPGDEAAIRAVVFDAFGGPARAHGAVVADLVDRFRASPDWVPGLSLVAQRGTEIVAHILFTRSRLDAPERLVDVLVLSPVSVAPAFQGRGIGSALIRYGLEDVAGRGEPLVFLEGDPRFYSRFGFVRARGLNFRRPSLRMPEGGFQVATLPAYEPWMTGTLVYSSVFWDLDLVGLRDPERFRQVSELDVELQAG